MKAGLGKERLFSCVVTNVCVYEPEPGRANPGTEGRISDKGETVYDRQR
jgi:hypothetical protein